MFKSVSEFLQSIYVNVLQAYTSHMDKLLEKFGHTVLSSKKTLNNISNSSKDSLTQTIKESKDTITTAINTSKDTITTLIDKSHNSIEFSYDPSESLGEFFMNLPSYIMLQSHKIMSFWMQFSHKEVVVNLCILILIFLVFQIILFIIKSIFKFLHSITLVLRGKKSIRFLHGRKEQKEEFYIDFMAKKLKGEKEVVLPNGTRCDILTKTHSIEVEFSEKWAESIGQSLNYAAMTHKKPGIVLVKRYETSEERFHNHKERIKQASDFFHLSIDVLTLNTQEFKTRKK